MSSPSGSKRIRLADAFCNRKPSLASCEDLLNDIFLRLPTKTLCRFKCVCNHWKSLISDPVFSMNHFRRHAAAEFGSNPIGVYFYNVFTSKQFGVSFAGPSRWLPTLTYLERRTVIEYACNGLMLCWNNDENCYVVTNPTTKAHTKFQIPESIAHFRHTSYLAFDPTKSPFFKVVVAAVFGDDIEFHIYSSQTASWKVVHARSDKSGMLHSRPAFYQGKFQWIGGKSLILRFDVEKERFSSVQLAELDDFTRYKCIRYFGVCKSKLVLVLSTAEKEQCFKVFEIDGNFTRWVAKAKIDLSTVMELPDTERSVVMCVLKTGKKEYDLVLAVFGEVVLYSMKTEMFEVLEHIPAIDLKSLAVFSSGTVYPFKETLVQI